MTEQKVSACCFATRADFLFSHGGANLPKPARYPTAYTLAPADTSGGGARPHDLLLPKRKEADSSPHEPDHPNKALVYFGALFVMTS